MIKQSGSRLLALLTAAPPLLWIGVFFLVPMAVVWLYSFAATDGLADIRPTGTLANYARAVEPIYVRLLVKSLALAALTTGVCLVLAFPVALVVAFSSSRTRFVLLMAVMLPFWTNVLVRTYALIAVLREHGYVNQVLEWLASALGLDWSAVLPLPLLYNSAAVVIGLVYVHLPFMILPLYSALDRIDRSLIEASLDLGATQVRTFFAVVVPTVRHGIITGAMLTFVPALGSYLTPDLLGGPSDQMLANIIEAQFKRANDWPFGAALSFLLVYLVFAMMALRTLGAAWNREGR